MKRFFVRSEKGVSKNVFKGMLTLAKGAMLARVVGLASIPLLTRIYSPEDFGVLALYTAIVTILGPVITLRYVQAIPLPKTDAMAFNLFSVCLVLIVLSSFVMAVAFALFGSTLLGLFDMQALVPWWPLIVLGVAGTALYELFSLWATRKKHYKVLATTQITQSLIGNAAKIILGLLAIKPAGLLVGQFLAQTGGVGSFIKQSLQDFKQLKPQVSKQKSAFVAKYYRDFPRYRLPSQFLMLLSLQAPVLMMAALYNKEVTGQLSLAMMALSLPAGLIGSAVAKAYYAEIAALGKNNIKEIKKITFEVQKKLFIGGLPLMVLAMLLAESAFVFAFGEGWRQAGQFSAKLALFILFQFTSAPLMEVINIVGKQAHYLILHLIRAFGLICLFFFFKHENVLVDDFVSFMSMYLAAFYFGASSFVFFILAKR